MHVLNEPALPRREGTHLDVPIKESLITTNLYYIPVVHCGLRKVPVSSFHGSDAQVLG